MFLKTQAMSFLAPSKMWTQLPHTQQQQYQLIRCKQILGRFSSTPPAQCEGGCSQNALWNLTIIQIKCIEYWTCDLYSLKIFEQVLKVKINSHITRVKTWKLSEDVEMNTYRAMGKWGLTMLKGAGSTL
jgi:hypothetical protein